MKGFWGMQQYFFALASDFYVCNEYIKAKMARGIGQLVFSAIL